MFHQLNRIEIAIGILNDFFEVLELKKADVAMMKLYRFLLESQTLFTGQGKPFILTIVFGKVVFQTLNLVCLLYTSPSPRDRG